MLVTKRNGHTEPLDIEKMQKVIEWAVHGDNGFQPIKGVSVSQIAISANPHFFSKIKTKAIRDDYQSFCRFDFRRSSKL